eukprot:6468122-Amphidinium_carterae.1
MVSATVATAPPSGTRRMPNGPKAMSHKFHDFLLPWRPQFLTRRKRRTKSVIIQSVDQEAVGSAQSCMPAALKLAVSSCDHLRVIHQDHRAISHVHLDEAVLIMEALESN